MILLIDNYDSFSYNLYQMIGVLDRDIRVIRNDAFPIPGIREMNPSGIILSPGPGRPEDAGVSVDLVRELGSLVPILGVCLGHQAITLAYGGKVVHAKKLMHGMQSLSSIDPIDPLFSGLNSEEKVGRYHSLAAEEASLPDCLRITARAEDGEIMALMHREYPVYGIQFHPESILTPCGGKILENFVKLARERQGEAV